MNDFFKDNSFIIFVETPDGLCSSYLLADKDQVEYDEQEDSIFVTLGKNGSSGDMEIKEVNSEFDVSTGRTDEGGKYLMLENQAVSIQFVLRNRRE